MNKNVLLISTTDESKFLCPLFSELAAGGWNFYGVINEPETLKQFRDNKWPAKIIPHWITTVGWFKYFLYIILYPLIFLGWLIFLLIWRHKHKLNAVICAGAWGKITITLAAKILKLPIYWLEFPAEQKQRLAGPAQLGLKIFRHWSRAICFTKNTKQHLLAAGQKEPNINLLALGISLADYQIQESIFLEIAATEKNHHQRKFFTIGTVADLDKNQKIEILLQAAKKCLEIIPILQIIIIGEGEAKKNLIWQAKKMGIENVVWFVGQQNHLKKWLTNFDIFVSTTNQINFNDMVVIIRAMAAGVPIIGAFDNGLDNFVDDYINGRLPETGSSEELTQNILQLEQNRELRQRLARQSRTAAMEKYSLKTMADKFKTIIETQ